MIKNIRVSDRYRMRIIAFIILIISLAVITYPRFNNQDLGPIKHFVGKVNGKPSLGDAPHYVQYVKYFKGIEIDTQTLRPPFSYRPFAPFAASLLPISNPMTSINIVNLFSLYTALLFLFMLLKTLNFNYWYSLLGCFMFSISFTTFYYGTIGYLDPVLICFLIIGTYFIFREKWLYLAMTLLIGSTVKETIVLLIPITFVYLITTNKPWKFKIIVLMLSYFLPTYLIRHVFIKSGSYYWYPSFTIFQGNLRLKALLSILFSIGIPGLLAICFMVNYHKIKNNLKNQFVYPIFAGVFFSMLLIIFSMFTAYTDGRFVWLLHIYTIPLSLWFIRKSKIINIKLLNEI